MTPEVVCVAYASEEAAGAAWSRVDAWLRTQAPIIAFSVQGISERGQAVVIAVVEETGRLDGCPWGDDGVSVAMGGELADSLKARIAWIRDNTPKGSTQHYSFPVGAEWGMEPDGSVAPRKRPQG